MSSLAEVKLWGKTIGAIVLEDGKGVGSFQYADDFTRSGIEVSPLEMPLSSRVYTFPVLSRHSFHGLPGLLADSLSDKYGNALIDEWLARVPAFEREWPQPLHDQAVRPDSGWQEDPYAIFSRPRPL